MKLDFVRGHMGGNLIILLLGEQMPPDRELDTAVRLLGPNYLHGHEAGLLYQTGKPGNIRVKIAEPTVPCFISACGGFTQVLGTALIETYLGKTFGLDCAVSPCEVILHTECGPTLLKIDHNGEKALRVKTDMRCFIEECYDRDVASMQIDDLSIMRSGKFMVVNADRFKERFPFADFVSWDNKTCEALTAIQDMFMKETGEVEPNLAFYDWHPAFKGLLRVVFPHYVRDQFFEPSCGTGSVALGLALLAAGELEHIEPDEHGWLSIAIESGGGRELGGPDLTTLEMKVKSGKAQEALFYHNRVEITSLGEVRV